MMDLVNFLMFWAKHHPIPIVAVVASFFVVTWLLNRRSAVDKEAERVVKDLIGSAKDKYKDTRPLR